MAISITGIEPSVGSSSGGDLVKVTGIDFSPNMAVLFGAAEAKVIVVRDELGQKVADVHTPAHAPDTVGVTVISLDEDGTPIPGAEFTQDDAYRFRSAQISEESDLTRLVRTLIQTIKQQLIENTSIAVSVDYDDTSADGLDVTAISKLPSLVLSGPRMGENRFYSINDSLESIVSGPFGPEVIRHRPPFTVDLLFSITVASDRTVELLNLMAAVVTFLNRCRWVEMQRSLYMPELGAVKWEMAPEGEFRTRLDEGDDVRVFTCGFVVRGFDIDEGGQMSIGRIVETTELEANSYKNGGVP